MILADRIPPAGIDISFFPNIVLAAEYYAFLIFN